MSNQDEFIKKVTDLLGLAQQAQDKISEEKKQGLIFDGLDSTVDDYLSRPGLSEKDAITLDPEVVEQIVYDLEHTEGDIRKFTVAVGATLDIVSGIFRMIV